MLLGLSLSRRIAVGKLKLVLALLLISLGAQRIHSGATSLARRTAASRIPASRPPVSIAERRD